MSCHVADIKAHRGDPFAYTLSHASTLRSSGQGGSGRSDHESHQRSNSSGSGAPISDAKAPISLAAHELASPSIGHASLVTSSLSSSSSAAAAASAQSLDGKVTHETDDRFNKSVANYIVMRGELVRYTLPTLHSICFTCVMFLTMI
jgi:hypothetical protein